MDDEIGMEATVIIGEQESNRLQVEELALGLYARVWDMGVIPVEAIYVDLVESDKDFWRGLAINILAKYK